MSEELESLYTNSRKANFSRVQHTVLEARGERDKLISQFTNSRFLLLLEVLNVANNFNFQISKVINRPTVTLLYLDLLVVLRSLW